MPGPFLSLSVLLVIYNMNLLLCTQMKSFALLLVDAEILAKAIFIISNNIISNIVSLL